MFCDKITIQLKAGEGGDGRVGFLHEKYREFGGPDGGDGGGGGDIIFKVNTGINTLYYYKTHKVLKAENGENGKRKKQRGKRGEDLILEIPKGTLVLNKNGELVADLSDNNSEEVILKGGIGGFGNAHFTTSTRQAPRVAELGEKGEEEDIVLELKLVADVGLVGLPNAGKSMLLSVISKAKPKVANYPFTTIVPNLGVVEGSRFGLKEGQGFVVCDVPGLIEDASKGKGLGDEFLRHVERNRLLVHLLDITSESILEDFETIQKELKDYKHDISKKKQLVVLTKVDIVDEKKAKENIKIISKRLKLKKYDNILNKKPIVISAVTHIGLKDLMIETFKTLSSISKEEAEKGDYKVFTLKDVDDKSGFTVEKKRDRYIVFGGKIEGFVARTDFSNPYAVQRLKDIMKKMGVEKELVRKGAKAGDKIKIKDKNLEF